MGVGVLTCEREGVTKNKRSNITETNLFEHLFHVDMILSENIGFSHMEIQIHVYFISAVHTLREIHFVPRLAIKENLGNTFLVPTY